MQSISKKIKNTNIIISTKTKVISKNKNKSKTIFSAFLIVLILLVVAYPNLCINSIYSGLSVWAKTVLPSLLPFMFFTKLLTNLNVINALTSKFYKFGSKLFNAPKISSYIFFMSVISGYPVGAKLISEYHKMGFISTKQANKLCSFCSTSGPLFIVGSVGVGMLLSAKIGYILLFSHIFSSILNGILFRNMFVDKTEVSFDLTSKKETQNLLGESMKDSVLSVLVVGGYIAVAFLIVDLFVSLNLFYPLSWLLEKMGVSGEIGTIFSSGFLEVSKGCLMISKTSLSNITKATFASFFIGFGGVSVFLQASTFLTEAKANLKFYFFQKITHGVLSAGLTFAICLLLGV